MLQGGEHVLITPDGPRGPRRQAAPGVAQLAALSGVPVLPCAAQTRAATCCRQLGPHGVPLPFGRGVIVCAAAYSGAARRVRTRRCRDRGGNDRGGGPADRLCRR